MSIPKRQYVVAVKRGTKTLFKWGSKLREAMALANLREGERFSYRVFEGGNSVECEWVGANRWRERGK